MKKIVSLKKLKFIIFLTEVVIETISYENK